MTLLLLIVVLLAVVAGVAYARSRDKREGTLARATSPPPPRPASRATPAADAPIAPAHDRADLGTLEWDGPPPTAAAVRPGALAPLAARIRDRYISARFPGVFRGSADLLEIEYVIKAARHCFEEGKFDRAHEIFALAIEQSPGERLLRLAQLEVAFLERDGPLFTTLARDLRTSFPDITEWDDVARLGRAIAPRETLFGADPGDHTHAQYGPWPEMPNWIQASWDLTAEVLGADFHRAMANRAGQGRAALRRVA